MNYLDFFASVIGSITSLAWPIAVVASAWIFRNEIRLLLPRMRLKHNETEFSFRLEEAEKAVGQLPPPLAESAPTTAEELSNFQRIARVSPRSAMMEMRREVEFTLKTLVERFGFKRNPWMPARRVLRELRKNNAIDAKTASLLDEVLAMGDAAAHDDQAQFTFEDAMRYRDVVDHAIRMLDVPPDAEPENYQSTSA